MRHFLQEVFLCTVGSVRFFVRFCEDSGYAQSDATHRNTATRRFVGESGHLKKEIRNVIQFLQRSVHATVVTFFLWEAGQDQIGRPRRWIHDKMKAIATKCIALTSEVSSAAVRCLAKSLERCRTQQRKQASAHPILLLKRCQAQQQEPESAHPILRFVHIPRLPSPIAAHANLGRYTMHNTKDEGIMMTFIAFPSPWSPQLFWFSLSAEHQYACSLSSPLLSLDTASLKSRDALGPLLPKLLPTVPFRAQRMDAAAPTQPIDRGTKLKINT